MDSLLPIRPGKQVGKRPGCWAPSWGARPLTHGLTRLPLVGDTGFEPVASSVSAQAGLLVV